MIYRHKYLLERNGEIKDTKSEAKMLKWNYKTKSIKSE